MITGEGHWFARSGSLLVILAVVVEFRNLTLQQRLNDKAAMSSRGLAGSLVPTGQPPIRQIVIVLAHLFVVAGTLLWGYGDLIELGP